MGGELSFVIVAFIAGDLEILKFVHRLENEIDMGLNGGYLLRQLVALLLERPFLEGDESQCFAQRELRHKTEADFNNNFGSVRNLQKSA